MQLEKMKQTDKIKYRVINPGTDVHNTMYTAEEICIAANINPNAFGAIQLAMASFQDCRFEEVTD